MEISAREAVEAAIRFAEELYRLHEDESSIEAVRVEEIEFNEEKHEWLISLGWNDKAFKHGAATITSQALTGRTAEVPRIHKVFRVSAEDAKIIGMKTR